jgi:hypothetical protein
MGAVQGRSREGAEDGTGTQRLQFNVGDPQDEETTEDKEDEQDGEDGAAVVVQTTHETRRGP